MSSFVGRLKERLKANTPRNVSEKKVEVRALIRSGVLGIPNNLSEPLILISVGAGISVFRGMLQERQEEKSFSSTGEVYVYYGCKKKDSPYVNELTSWEVKGIINKLDIAFSQEDEPKVHVQDILKAQKNDIYNLIKEKNATIMVCASLSVEQNIKEALIEVFKHREKNPNALFEQIKSEKRYMKQLWNY